MTPPELELFREQEKLHTILVQAGVFASDFKEKLNLKMVPSAETEINFHNETVNEGQNQSQNIESPVLFRPHAKMQEERFQAQPEHCFVKGHGLLDSDDVTHEADRQEVKTQVAAWRLREVPFAADELLLVGPAPMWRPSHSNGRTFNGGMSVAGGVMAYAPRTSNVANMPELEESPNRPPDPVRNPPLPNASSLDTPGHRPPNATLRLSRANSVPTFPSEVQVQSPAGLLRWSKPKDLPHKLQPLVVSNGEGYLPTSSGDQPTWQVLKPSESSPSLSVAGSPALVGGAKEEKAPILTPRSRSQATTNSPSKKRQVVEQRDAHCFKAGWFIRMIPQT